MWGTRWSRRFDHEKNGGCVWSRTKTNPIVNSVGKHAYFVTVGYFHDCMVTRSEHLPVYSCAVGTVILPNQISAHWARLWWWWWFMATVMVTGTWIKYRWLCGWLPWHVISKCFLDIRNRSVCTSWSYKSLSNCHGDGHDHSHMKTPDLVVMIVHTPLKSALPTTNGCAVLHLPGTSWISAHSITIAITISIPRSPLSQIAAHHHHPSITLAASDSWRIDTNVNHPMLSASYYCWHHS